MVVNSHGHALHTFPYNITVLFIDFLACTQPIAYILCLYTIFTAPDISARWLKYMTHWLCLYRNERAQTQTNWLTPNIYKAIIMYQHYGICHSFFVPSIYNKNMQGELYVYEYAKIHSCSPTRNILCGALRKAHVLLDSRWLMTEGMSPL